MMDLSSKIDFSTIKHQNILDLIIKIERKEAVWNSIIDSIKVNNRDKIIARKCFEASLQFKGNDKNTNELQFEDFSKLLFNTKKSSDLVSEKSIQSYHSTLLNHISKYKNHRGKYKFMSVGLFIKDIEPTFVAQTMSELTSWAKNAFESKSIHPLLVIGLFHYEFAHIQPFQNENTTLVFLLTQQLLANNYSFFNNHSALTSLTESRKSYIDQLTRNSEDSLENWMTFFLTQLVKTNSEIDSKTIENKVSKPVYINQRQKLIISFIKRKQSVKVADLTLGFPEISINTIKKDVLILKDLDKIQSSGKNKGTIYFI